MTTADSHQGTIIIDGGTFISPSVLDFKIEGGTTDAYADGVGFVGEAAGDWLWLLAWPASAAAVLLARFPLIDLRDPGHTFDLPCGALTPRLG